MRAEIGRPGQVRWIVKIARRMPRERQTRRIHQTGDANEDYRFIHVGPLSTIIFLGLVAYAVSVHHLFNVRILVRSTVVFAVLIGVFLEFYRIAVDALAHLLPLQDAAERQIAATAVALIVNAFSHEALKHWLDHLIDRTITRHRKPGRRP